MDEKRYEKFALYMIVLFCMLFVQSLFLISTIIYQANLLTSIIDNYPDQINVVVPERTTESPIESDDAMVGKASWYDYPLAGTIWSKEHATAASRFLARYSYAKVTNLNNQKSVEVFINDYGPEACPELEPDCYLKDRIIDLSSYAFSQIGDLRGGLIDVAVTPLE